MKAYYGISWDNYMSYITDVREYDIQADGIENFHTFSAAKKALLKSMRFDRAEWSDGINRIHKLKKSEVSE